MRKALLLLMIAAPLLAQGPPPNQNPQAGRNPRGFGRAGGPPAAGPADPNAVSADALLRQVRQDAQQLGPPERAFMLGKLVTTAERLQPDQVRPLADEIFLLAPQLPEALRGSSEVPAVTAMANSDPEYALQLLQRMDPPAPDASGVITSDPRCTAASNVFTNYWHKKQGAGLDDLRSVASHLAENGSYPYAALALILPQLNRKDPATGEMLFSEALRYYRASSGQYYDNQQFIQFLFASNRAVPNGLFREGVTMAVANVERLLANTSSSTGNASPANQNASLMRQLLPMVRQIDPDWATRLAEAHGHAGGVAGGGAVGAAGGPGMFQAPAPGARMQGFGPNAMANNNPQNITDPVARATVTAQRAFNMAQSNPQQATVLLDQATIALGQLDDPVSQLKVLAWLALGAYATGRRDDAAHYMERGFTLGDEVVRKDFDEHPDRAVYSLNGVDELVNLTRAAMTIDARGTLAHLNGVRYPLLRVYLTLNAAESLQAQRWFGPGGPGAGGGGVGVGVNGLPAPNENAAPNRVRVSQGVAAGYVAHRAAPVYPALARQARITGDVVLQVVIGRDGGVQDALVVSGHPMLIQAAIDAVKQWQFRPYQLDGRAVEVETQVTIAFALAEPAPAKGTQ